MNIVKWQEIYDENKRLDDIFERKYHNDGDLYSKNCLELLVELGEFANETKIFKYWTNKSPEKDKMLEEYADVITMCLYFFHEFQIQLKEGYSHAEIDDKIVLINYLYERMTMLLNKDYYVIEDIFGNVLYLGKLFNFKEDEVLQAISDKHEIISKRLNGDY